MKQQPTTKKTRINKTRETKTTKTIVKQFSDLQNDVINDFANYLIDTYKLQKSDLKNVDKNHFNIMPPFQKIDMQLFACIINDQIIKTNFDAKNNNDLFLSMLNDVKNNDAKIYFLFFDMYQLKNAIVCNSALLKNVYTFNHYLSFTSLTITQKKLQNDEMFKTNLFDSKCLNFTSCTNDEQTIIKKRLNIATRHACEMLKIPSSLFLDK